MAQWQRVNGTDVVDVPPALDDKYKADPAWEPHKAPKAKASASSTGTGSN